MSSVMFMLYENENETASTCKELLKSIQEFCKDTGVAIGDVQIVTQDTYTFSNSSDCYGTMVVLTDSEEAALSASHIFHVLLDYHGGKEDIATHLNPLQEDITELNALVMAADDKVAAIESYKKYRTIF